jgi:hypothetical protein
MRDTRYIYTYRPGGRAEGSQVRFKRMHDGKIETVSRYFRATKYGGLNAAEKAARRWRDRNMNWISDRSFEPGVRKPRRQGARVRRDTLERAEHGSELGILLAAARLLDRRFLGRTGGRSPDPVQGGRIGLIVLPDPIRTDGSRMPPADERGGTPTASP